MSRDREQRAWYRVPGGTVIGWLGLSTILLLASIGLGVVGIMLLDVKVGEATDPWKVRLAGGALAAIAPGVGLASWRAFGRSFRLSTRYRPSDEGLEIRTLFTRDAIPWSTIESIEGTPEEGYRLELKEGDPIQLSPRLRQLRVLIGTIRSRRTGRKQAPPNWL